MDRVLAIRSLGDGDISKLPDLLFDVKSGETAVRCALEIERTRKSSGRYQTMSRAYQKAVYVDAVIFGVADAKIEELIEKEIFEAGLGFAGKDVGFFRLADFEDQKFDAALRLSGRELTLEDYFQSISSVVPGSAEFRRHGVRAELLEVTGE